MDCVDIAGRSSTAVYNTVDENGDFQPVRLVSALRAVTARTALRTSL